LVTVAAIVASTPALLLLGTVMAGLGFGPGNLGAYRVIMARAASSDRAGLIAAISIVNYLAFGLPALIAGIATSHFGLHDTALVYSVVIALLAVAAAGGFLFEGNARTRAPRAVAPLPNCRRARAPCHRARKQRPRKPSQRRHPSNHLQQPATAGPGRDRG
jgi:MFS family permease